MLSLAIRSIVIMGRKIDAEEHFLQKIGIKSISFGGTNDYSNEELIDFINQDKPIVLNTDRYYLDYLSKRFGRSHFGHHSVIVHGYRTGINGELEYALLDFH